MRKGALDQRHQVLESCRQPAASTCLRLGGCCGHGRRRCPVHADFWAGRFLSWTSDKGEGLLAFGSLAVALAFCSNETQTGVCFRSRRSFTAGCEWFLGMSSWNLCPECTKLSPVCWWPWSHACTLFTFVFLAVSCCINYLIFSGSW